jgi:hypothetical protein
MASLENFPLVVFRTVAGQLSFCKAAEELYLPLGTMDGMCEYAASCAGYSRLLIRVQ